jgi:glycosyltransferase involved in cell wall biosynthesis
MKILFIITQGHSGGAQKYVLDLITGLSALHEVFLAIGEDKDKSFQEQIYTKNPKTTIFELKHLKRDISPKHDILAILELHRLYTELKPDIVHLNSSKAGVLGALARTKHTKIVYTVHGWVFLEALSKAKKLLYQGLEYISSRFQDATIVLSPQEYTIAQKTLHIPKKQLSLIPLGIEKIQFLEKENARKKLCEQNPDLDPNIFWTGTIANHYLSKGLDVFIEAVSKFSDEEKKKIQCIIIGDGPERKNLETLIEKYQLQKTFFLLPFLPNASIYIKAFDLFVLPSRKEGLPYTLLETLQAKIPILATNVGGIPSLLETNPNAKIIKANNPELLKEHILYFFKNTKTLKTKEENTHYSLHEMLEKTKSLYQNILTTSEAQEDSRQT